MIRVRDGDEETILTIDDFERRARRGELSPFAMVCIPALTGGRFVQARELPLFVALYDPRRILFRRHFQLGRLPLLTGALALACVALFFIARHLGEGAVTREALLDLGAKARARIVEDGEAWRLLAANLLHRDLVHLGFNLFALVNIGAVLEGVYRRGDYVLLLVVSGIATMATSTVMSGPVSVGASGLVFGCLGCAVVFGLRFSEVLPLRYRIYFGVVVVGYAATMFYLGLQRPTTDNWGHAGGLVAGLVMGGLIEPRLLRLKGPREPVADLVRPWAMALALAVAVVAFGPLLPRLFFRYEPYSFDAFGVVVERPSTWTKGPDPLGFLAFGNGVDALTSLACARLDEPSRLPEAEKRFIDGELLVLSRGGHIGDLQLGEATDAVVGGATASVPARQIPFSFMASDGPFRARALLFSRGDIECAFVLAHRASATASSVAVLEEIRGRLRLVPTRGERLAEAGTLAKPESLRAWLELALARQSGGDVDGARAAFARAVELLAHDAGYSGRVRFASGRFELVYGNDLDRALSEAVLARASSKDDPDAALLVIDVLLARREGAKAREALKAAVTSWPDDTRFTERVKLLGHGDEHEPAGGPPP